VTELENLMQRRIVILDGAMGTMIQSYQLDESGYRGRQLASHPYDLKGCNDLLCLTQPEIVETIHRQYLEAGADIIETNTFNSTSISMADYHLEHLVYDLNLAGARVARRAVEAVKAKHQDRPGFVAGAIGPTNRTASMSATNSVSPLAAIPFGACRVTPFMPAAIQCAFSMRPSGRTREMKPLLSFSSGLPLMLDTRYTSLAAS